MLHLQSISAEHTSDIVDLIATRYREVLTSIPLLPNRYTQKDVITGLLNSILDSAPGVVAYDGKRIVGFLCAWALPSFRGRPAVFSPEWGNATIADNSRTVYQAMYEYVAEKWVAAGYGTHLISQYADRSDDSVMWQWLGFGMCAVDGVRALTPLDVPAYWDIKLATQEHIQPVYLLNQQLEKHLYASPTFLYGDEPATMDDVVSWINDTNQAVWLGIKDGKVIGFFRQGPASEQASTIIEDPGTTSIMGAYTVPEHRGQGLAAALLNRTIQWGLQEHYLRCCVDFEPMNVLAARFWTRHFTLSSYVLARFIDIRYFISQSQS